MPFEKTIAALKELTALAKSVPAQHKALDKGAQSTSQVNPDVVGAALAEFLKRDSVDAQMISIRVGNWINKYPNKAA